jgi:hypothetical protein
MIVVITCWTFLFFFPFLSAQSRRLASFSFRPTENIKKTYIRERHKNKKNIGIGGGDTMAAALT